MFEWNQHRQLHVIRSLKNLIDKLWNSEVFFLDDSKNYIKLFNDQNSNNLVLSKILKKPQLTQPLFETLYEKTSTSNEIQLVEWDKTGLGVLAVPIFSNKTWEGLVGVTGFVTNKENYDKFFQFLNTEGHLNFNKKVSCLDKNQLFYIEEILVSLAQEIIMVHEEKRKKQKHLIKNYSHSSFRYGEMIGKSKVMQNLYILLDKIKHSDSSILIQGENGTGKELVAQAIYQYSSRKDEAFITQNCATLNDNLLESELFGHVKGAFTGAIQDKKGLFELAHKGTLFLDEIGDTSLAMQAKLLRVLQEGQFFSVGSVKSKTVDVRIIAATNKDLNLMMNQKTFREDLYYRLNVVNIKVPSLRERKEDIPLLIEFFMSQQQGGNVKKFNSVVLELLKNYPWSGNVRELQNEVQRMFILSQQSAMITEEHLSHKFFKKLSTSLEVFSSEEGLKIAVKKLEKEMISKCLEEERWNKTRVAKKLGISRAALISKVKDYALERKNRA